MHLSLPLFLYSLTKCVQIIWGPLLSVYITRLLLLQKQPRAHTTWNVHENWLHASTVSNFATIGCLRYEKVHNKLELHVANNIHWLKYYSILTTALNTTEVLDLISRTAKNAVFQDICPQNKLKYGLALCYCSRLLKEGFQGTEIFHTTWLLFNLMTWNKWQRIKCKQDGGLKRWKSLEQRTIPECSLAPWTIPVSHKEFFISCVSIETGSSALT